MRTKKKRDSFRDYVLEQLGTEVTCRAMFGGHGLYHGDRIFGIVYQGRLYFTTSPLTRPDFINRRMEPFKPNARQTLRSYYEVPVDVLEEADMLRAWARRASL